MASNKLTALQIEKAAPGKLHDGDGLVCVRSKAGWNWVYKYTKDGRSYEMGIGGKSVSLAEARVERDKLKAERLAGGHPALDRKEQGARKAVGIGNLTPISKVSEVLDYYYETKVQPELMARSKTNSQWAILVKNNLPEICGLPVNRVSPELIEAELLKIWYVKTPTAKRARQRLAKVLGFAKHLGLISGDNPAEWRGNLEFRLPSPNKIHKAQHYAYMPWEHVPEMWKAMKEKSQDSASVEALRLLILSATRLSDVTGARWSEFDLAKGLWTIPGARHNVENVEDGGHKSGADFVVPITFAMEEVLQRRKKAYRKADNDLVFASPKAHTELTQAAITAVSQHYGGKNHTNHGFRTTFKTWADEHGVVDFVSEMIIAHQVGNEVVRAYKRSEVMTMRFNALSDYNDFVTGESAATSDVISLQAAREARRKKSA